MHEEAMAIRSRTQRIASSSFITLSQQATAEPSLSFLWVCRSEPMDKHSSAAQPCERQKSHQMSRGMDRCERQIPVPPHLSRLPPIYFPTPQLLLRKRVSTAPVKFARPPLNTDPVTHEVVVAHVHEDAYAPLQQRRDMGGRARRSVKARPEGFVDVEVEQAEVSRPALLNAERALRGRGGEVGFKVTVWGK